MQWQSRKAKSEYLSSSQCTPPPATPDSDELLLPHLLLCQHSPRATSTARRVLEQDLKQWIFITVLLESCNTSGMPPREDTNTPVRNTAGQAAVLQSAGGTEDSPAAPSPEPPKFFKLHFMKPQSVSTSETGLQWLVRNHELLYTTF